jgi:hypothetical protein
VCQLSLSPRSVGEQQGAQRLGQCYGRCMCCQGVANCSGVKDGPSFYGGGIYINCLEDNGGRKGVVVGGGWATICIN